MATSHNKEQWKWRCRSFLDVTAAYPDGIEQRGSFWEVAPSLLPEVAAPLVLKGGAAPLPRRSGAAPSETSGPATSWKHQRLSPSESSGGATSQEDRGSHIPKNQKKKRGCDFIPHIIGHVH